MSRVLITGMSGSLAQLCAEDLLEAGHEVIGVDYRRRRPGMRRAVTFYRANYNKRIIEDVFRKHPPETVIHLGRVGNLKTRSNKRFDLNVVGSAKILELCPKHKVKRLIVLSTYHIYGAHHANHIPISEEDPLRAGQMFPQLSDAVQLDNLATTWVYRHRKLKTIVLRPCNIIGPNLNNAISTYLRQGTQTYLMGFNPMWQFIHELDMVRAILGAMKSDAVGIFNVAGAGSIPIKTALGLTGATLLPIPAPLASAVLGLSGSFTIPHYYLEFLKYPCVISDAKFREVVDHTPHMSTREAIQSTVVGA